MEWRRSEDKKLMPLVVGGWKPEDTRTLDSAARLKRRET